MVAFGFAGTGAALPAATAATALVVLVACILQCVFQVLPAGTMLDHEVHLEFSQF